MEWGIITTQRNEGRGNEWPALIYLELRCMQEAAFWPERWSRHRVRRFSWSGLLLLVRLGSCVLLPRHQISDGGPACMKWRLFLAGWEWLLMAPCGRVAARGRARGTPAGRSQRSAARAGWTLALVRANGDLPRRDGRDARFFVLDYAHQTRRPRHAFTPGPLPILDCARDVAARPRIWRRQRSISIFWRAR